MVTIPEPVQQGCKVESVRFKQLGWEQFLDKTGYRWENAFKLSAPTVIPVGREQEN